MLNGTNGQTSTRKKSDSLTDTDKKSPISGFKDSSTLGTIKLPDKAEATKVDSKASITNKENNSKGSKDTKTTVTSLTVKKK